MIRALIFINCLAFASVFQLFAQPEIKAVFTETPPVIDGSVNDEVWQKASVINELFQREPNPAILYQKKLNSISYMTMKIFISEYAALMILME